jgi:hypothetical protein
MVLSDRAAGVADDARNQLDSACRFAGTFAVTTVVLVGLLVAQPPWLVLALIPVLVAWLSYGAAIAAARRYGLAIQAAFDLYRLELLDAMGLPRPADADAERVTAGKVSEWLAQGRPHRLPYRQEGA